MRLAGCDADTYRKVGDNWSRGDRSFSNGNSAVTGLKPESRLSATMRAAEAAASRSPRGRVNMSASCCAAANWARFLFERPGVFPRTRSGLFRRSCGSAGSGCNARGSRRRGAGRGGRLSAGAETGTMMAWTQIGRVTATSARCSAAARALVFARPAAGARTHFLLLRLRTRKQQT